MVGAMQYFYCSVASARLMNSNNNVLFVEATRFTCYNFSKVMSFYTRASPW